MPPKQTNPNIPIITPPPRTAPPRPAKWLFVVVAVCVIGLASALLIRSQNQQGALATQDHLVTITATAFDPATITIKKGDAITWTNNDSQAHTIAVDDAAGGTPMPSLRSAAPITHGQTYSFTFTKIGTYHYYDPAFPTHLKATIVVQ